MESASAAAGGLPARGQAGAGGLKQDAIGYISNVVIGVASTAPGYSIAATLGFVVAVEGVGLAAPAVMLISFVPMLCIAFAYRYMNQADPDCGTTFSWATRGLGPSWGWLGGWAIVVTDIIVMASLSQIAAIYSFLLFDWESAANSQVAVMIVGVAWIVVMTMICYLGTELSARTQQILLAIEIFALGLFAIWALAKVYVSSPAGSMHVQASWFSPFSIDSFSALADGVLLGTFIYWAGTAAWPSTRSPRTARTGPARRRW
jgi:amino acid transporter